MASKRCPESSTRRQGANLRRSAVCARRSAAVFTTARSTRASSGDPTAMTIQPPNSTVRCSTTTRHDVLQPVQQHQGEYRPAEQQDTRDWESVRQEEDQQGRGQHRLGIGVGTGEITAYSPARGIDMKFAILIYTDRTLLDALPAGQFDAKMRDCLAHADELRQDGRLTDSQMLESATA